MTDSQSKGSYAENERDSSRARLAKQVLRQWPLVLSVAVCCSIAGFASSTSQPEKFRSTATIQTGQLDLSQLFLRQSTQSTADSLQRESITSVSLITLPAVFDLASKNLGGAISAEDLSRNVEAKAEPGSNLIRVTADARLPALASRSANATVDAFIEQQRRTSVLRLADARSEVRAELDALSPAQRRANTGRTLRERLRQIDLLGTFGTSVNVVQRAQPPSAAVGPLPKRSALVALVIGGLLGLSAALIRARLDDRIRDPDEFREMWSLPLAGTIPRDRELKTLGAKLPSDSSREAFALARSNLRYLHVGGDLKVLSVTSAVAEEGKSTVLWNLALAATLAGTRVLVIDADLRRPSLTQQLGVGGNRGLTEVLSGLMEIHGSISTLPFGDSRSTLGGKIDVLPAGTVPPNPIVLLEGGRFDALLSRVRDDYDLILVDTPPATAVADTVVIVGQTDAVLVVSRAGHVRRRAFERLRRNLEGAGTPVVAQVMNRWSSGVTYGYGADYKATASETQPSAV